MIPLLLKQLTYAWREAVDAAGIRLSPPLSALPIGGQPGAMRKVNVLVFSAGAAEPALLLKLVRDTAYQFQLRQEYETLTCLGQRPELQGTIPRPVGLFTWDERLVLAEQFLGGVPLSVLLKQRKARGEAAVAHHLEQSLGWLHRFQSGRPAAKRRFEGWRAIAERLDLVEPALPRPFVERLKELADEYEGISLPFVPMHGDFWPGNVLLDGERLAVTDWETFQPGCLPFRDLFLFLTSYVQNHSWRWWPRVDPAERFRRGFLADTWLSREIAAALTAFFHQLRLPPPAARLFYPLFLLEMARPTAAEGEKRRQQAAPWQATLRQYARATTTILDGVSE